MSARVFILRLVLFAVGALLMPVVALATDSDSTATGADTSAVAASRLSSDAVKSVDAVSAPLPWYLIPSPVKLPVACSCRRLPETLASTFAIPVNG